MATTTVVSSSPSPSCGNAAFSPWTAAPLAAFPLHIVPELFVQGDLLTENPPHYPPRLGLLPKKTWSDVDAALDAYDGKLFIFLRHGEGLHNADKARVGAAAWEETYQYSSDYIDAPLTKLGVEQAVDAGKMLGEELRNGGLEVDLVVVSPLERTLYTYKHACEGLSLTAPVVSMELVRETLGVCPCDQRTATAPKREAFPHVDFTCVKDDDEWWQQDHRETDAEVNRRAQEFLLQIYRDYPQRRILVVSHSGFTRACMRVLGHRYYRPANGELIPVVVHSADKRSVNEEL